MSRQPRRSIESLPQEFDIIQTATSTHPFGIGYTMHGWDFTRAELVEAIAQHRMLNPAMELGTNACPWNCNFCFTEDPLNTDGSKRRLLSEMSIERRLQLIDEAAKLGVRSINFVGAGEPTIDPNFWELIERMHLHSIVPIVYTEGALRLTDRSFVERLYVLGVTLVFKMNSLRNATYQNMVVAGDGIRKNPRHENYLRDRNRAIDLCIDVGFNRHDPTRLAFDTIVCRQNFSEILSLHRYARSHNIFVLFVNYLPSGRSKDPHHDALTRTEQFELFERLAQVDRQEFGIEHASGFPYGGSTPCTIRGMGLYVKIGGHVWDCPGELESLGNLRTESLKELWERARPITTALDGGCAPRENFWRNLAQPKLSIEKHL